MDANKYLLKEDQWITWREIHCVFSQKGHWDSEQPEGRVLPSEEAVSHVSAISLLWPK